MGWTLSILLNRSAFKKVLAEVGHQWAQALDERGKPGMEVLRAFQKSLEDAPLQKARSGGELKLAE